MYFWDSAIKSILIRWNGSMEVAEDLLARNEDGFVSKWQRRNPSWKLFQLLKRTECLMIITIAVFWLLQNRKQQISFSFLALVVSICPPIPYFRNRQQLHKILIHSIRNRVFVCVAGHSRLTFLPFCRSRK